MPRRNRKALSFQERQAMETTLYDCSLDLKIDIPRHKRADINNIYKVTLITIAIEFIAKHTEYQRSIDSIYNILKNTLSVTKRHWKVVNKERLVLERNDETTGNILQNFMPKHATAVYDTVEFSGIVCDSDVIIECKLELFLNRGVLAAKHIYDDHNFPVDSHETNIREDLHGFINIWCHALSPQERELTGSDFNGSWGLVLTGLKDQTNYYEMSRIRRAPTPEPMAEDGGDDDSDLDN